MATDGTSLSDTGLPKVSVVCAWYNRAAYLHDTLDSLLAQDFDDFDITIVNDGSPDPRVREILDGYSDPRLRVIHQENTGFVGAIRRAIDASRGEYIAVMGAGDISLPARLRVQAAALDAGPQYVGVGCSFRNVTIGYDGSVLGAVDKPRGAREVTYERIQREHSPFSHGEVMYRRSAYVAVSGYRKLFRFAQDVDLWLRMSRLGPFTICPEYLYERRVFKADGIQGDLRKAVIQAGLAHLAHECARLHDRHGVDFVDLFGDQAGLMYSPDAVMTRIMGKTAIRYMWADMKPEAAFFVAMAARGPISAYSIAARALFMVFRVRRFRPFVQRMLAKLPIVGEKEALPIPVLRAGKRIDLSD